MMINETITLIVPFYKSEAYLHKCLLSIINQTYSNLEILLIDDGSPDLSVQIAQTFADRDSRIRIIHQNNSGISCARNKGISLASGQYIMFIDSDDDLPLDSVQRLHDAIATHNTAMAVGSRIVISNRKSKTVHIPQALIKQRNDLHAYFLSQNNEDHYAWGKLYKREVFNSVRFPEGRIFEDISVFHSILEAASSAVIIDHPVYHYYLHPDSLSNSSSLEKMEHGLNAQIDAYHFYEINYPEISKYAVIEIVNYCCFLLGRIYRSGKRRNLSYWHSTLQIAKKYLKLLDSSLYYKTLEISLSIFPDLCGFLFQLYSTLKN